MSFNLAKYQHGRLGRAALIIGNAGLPSDIHYCTGVYRDLDRYEAFLKQPYGGLWGQREIRGPFHRPSLHRITRLIEDLSRLQLGYALVIFTGHGFHSHGSTKIVLRTGEYLDERAFNRIARRTALILDCCRTGAEVELTESKIIKTAAAQAPLHSEECRDLYNEAIKECGPMHMVVYACRKRG